MKSTVGGSRLLLATSHFYSSSFDSELTFQLFIVALFTIEAWTESTMLYFLNSALFSHSVDIYSDTCYHDKQQHCFDSVARTKPYYILPLPALPKFDVDSSLYLCTKGYSLCLWYFTLTLL